MSGYIKNWDLGKDSANIARICVCRSSKKKVFCKFRSNGVMLSVQSTKKLAFYSKKKKAPTRLNLLDACGREDPFLEQTILFLSSVRMIRFQGEV